MAEFLKGGGKDLMEQLTRLEDIIWEQEQIPTGWHVSVFYPIHKKGDPMVYQNYRGISLINISYKIISNIILK